MSRWSALLVVVAIIALSVADPSRAAASNGAAIKAVGGGWVGFAPDTSRHYVQFSFSAHTGPQGDFGSAQFSITNEFGFALDVSADIDCLNVFAVPGYHGGAWFSGIVTKANDPSGLNDVFVGDRIYFSALDGGEPGLGSVDNFEAWHFPPGSTGPGISCKLIDAYVEPPDVTSGNIVIDDPLVLP